MVSKWCPKDIKAYISMPINEKPKLALKGERIITGSRFAKEK